MMMDDPVLWNFKFGVEVSARYHDWRRGTLDAAVRGARTATLVGAILALLTAFNPLDWAPELARWIIAGLAIVIGCINLWELATDLDKKALMHTELYRRFMALQERMIKERDAWDERLPEWEATAAAIRRDEPPTMWAVYAMCWNQTMDRLQLERKGYYRPVRWWQHRLRNLFQFSPQDFPASA